MEPFSPATHALATFGWLSPLLKVVYQQPCLVLNSTRRCGDADITATALHCCTIPRGMLAMDPTKRLTCPGCLQHPYLAALSGHTASASETQQSSESCSTAMDSSHTAQATASTADSGSNAFAVAAMPVSQAASPMPPMATVSITAPAVAPPASKQPMVS